MRRIVTSLVLIVLFSCDSDESPSSGYHITVEFPNAMNRAADIVANDETTVIATNFKSVEKNQLLLTGISETGAILWSKKLSASGKDILSVVKVIPIDENSFMVIAAGEFYRNPIVIESDYTGKVLSAKSYFNSANVITINSCAITAEGSKVFSGTYFNSGGIERGMVFMEDAAGNILWAKTINHLTNAAVINQSQTGICVLVPSPYDGLGVVALDENGTFISANTIDNSDFVFEEVQSMGDNFYAVSSIYQSQGFVIAKLNSDGNVIGLLNAGNAYTYNPDLTIVGSSLFMVSSLEDNFKVVEFDSDFNVLNSNTFARLVGSGGNFRGKIAVSNDAINCLMEPFSGDPTFGDRGVNVIKVPKSSWKPRCEIAKPIEFKSYPTNFQSEPLEDVVVGDYQVENSSVTIQTIDQTIDMVHICK